MEGSTPALSLLPLALLALFPGLNVLSAPDTRTASSWLKIPGSRCTPLSVGPSPFTA